MTEASSSTLQPLSSPESGIYGSRDGSVLFWYLYKLEGAAELRYTVLHQDLYAFPLVYLDYSS